MAHISELFRSQQAYFRQGNTRNVKTRLNNLQTLKRLVKENENAIIEAIYNDFKKPRFETIVSEIGTVKGEIDFIAKNLRKWVHPKRVATNLLSFPAKSSILHEPFGTSLIIAPWNYPFDLAIGPAVGALAAGNTAIIKPSEFTPYTSQLIEDLITNYFEPELLSVVQGGIAETQELLNLPFDKIFFTGSPQVGKVVMSAAAKHLSSVTLELGGKSPVILDKGVNLRIATKRIASGKFFNAGQTCIAPDYALVPRQLTDSFVEQMERAIGEFFGPDPKASPDFARIVNEKHFDRIAGYLAEEEILVGGSIDRESRYISPTLVKAKSPESPLLQEELFGPVLPIVSYDTLEEAIKFVQDRPKPLSLYLFSRSRATKEKVTKTLSYGGAVINDTLEHFINPNLPFGGVGNSGIGGYHGFYSFEAFSHRKALMSKGQFPDIPLKFPPYGKKDTWMKRLFRLAGQVD